jgi:hypothetical protein
MSQPIRGRFRGILSLTAVTLESHRTSVVPFAFLTVSKNAHTQLTFGSFPTFGFYRLTQINATDPYK